MTRAEVEAAVKVVGSLLDESDGLKADLEIMTARADEWRERCAELEEENRALKAQLMPPARPELA